MRPLQAKVEFLLPLDRVLWLANIAEVLVKGRYE
jgi:hypothetical protein